LDKIFSLYWSPHRERERRYHEDGFSNEMTYLNSQKIINYLPLNPKQEQLLSISDPPLLNDIFNNNSQFEWKKQLKVIAEN
jgi:hypothetical protein